MRLEAPSASLGPSFQVIMSENSRSAEFGPKGLKASDPRGASSLRDCGGRMTSGADHRSHDGQACINVHERTDDAAAMTRKRRPPRQLHGTGGPSRNRPSHPDAFPFNG